MCSSTAYGFLVKSRLLLVEEVQLCAFPTVLEVGAPDPSTVQGQVYVDTVAVISYYTTQNLL